MNHSEAGKLGYQKIKHRLKKYYEDKHQKVYLEYMSNPKHCLQCNKILPYEKSKNNFCSHSCSGSFNNKGVCRNGKPKEIINCLFCNKEIYVYNNIYCNKECESNYKWKLKKEEIEKGLTKSPYIQRKYLKEKYGCICSICGLDKWMGEEIPLVLYHIDGNSENNFPSNLRLVCGNCNMQLPTFAGKNAGNGRKKRRDHYRPKSEVISRSLNIDGDVLAS